MKRSRKVVQFILITVLCLPLITALAPARSEALSGSSFRAGRIIDNSVFFNGEDLSITQIQKFLNAKVPNCDTNGDKTIYDPSRGDTVTRRTYAARRGISTPFICLKNYKVTTTDKASEPGLCSSYDGKPDQSAATIIYHVSKACGISAKALIVLLEKEQSLVTDDWPWPIQYRSATGYGCPDTAPCDSQYYGFFNQVYRAARQFKRYAKDAELFNYRAGRDNRIPYHPNSSCGYSTVYIENQATAGLYNYTPYRPNKAALNNLYGTGNSCSSYGNRNFWRMFNDWFGSTTGKLTLIKTSGDATIYLTNNNKKIAISSLDALTAWGLTRYAVKTVNPSVLDIYETSVSPLERIAISRSSGYKYLADSGKAYQMQTATTYAWGFAGVNAPKVEKKIITYLAVKPKVPVIAQPVGSSTIYLVVNGKKLPISDMNSLRVIKGSTGMGVFSPSLISRLQTYPAINYAFKVANTWYVFDSGKIRAIDSAYTERWNLSGPTVSSNILALFKKSKTLGKGFYYDGKYYRIKSDGSLQSTKSVSGAKLWGVYDAPKISKYLFNEIK